MLIEFKVANYRSFCGRQTLSMVAGVGKEHWESHTADSGLADLRLLRSAVIYGPNAAGKTNLLRALQFMQILVINSATSAHVSEIPYDPFKLSSATRDAPTEFEVTFVQNGTRYEYGLTIGPARIHKEWLIEYPRGRARRMFERIYDDKKGEYDWSFSTHFKGNRSVWRDTTRPTALFLSTAVQLNSAQLLPVFEWFQKRVVVIVGNTTLNQSLTMQLLNKPDGKERLLPFLREADPGVADLEVRREPMPQGVGTVMIRGQPIIEQTAPNSPPNLVRITFSHKSSDNNEKIGIDIGDESNGTQVLFTRAGAWLNIFANGEILLFDEIETSLHPLLVHFLVNQFHSNEHNKNNSQLIFSTHNTSLLNQELLRRDQVWFVEKGRDAGSKLFPLTDFSPRKDEVIEKGYLRGRYGALPIFHEFNP